MKWMSDSWYIRVRGGTCCYPTFNQAEEEHGAVIKNVAEDKSFLNRIKPVSWDDAEKRLLQELNERNQPRTVTFYEGRLKTLKAAFGKKMINKISREDIDDYVTSRLRLVSETSVNRELTTLRRLLLFAQKRKWLFENPMKDYKMFEEKERERVLTEDEEEKLYTACLDKRAPDHLFPIVITARETMLRKTDVLTLRISEIDFEDGVIRKKVVKQRRGKEEVI